MTEHQNKQDSEDERVARQTIQSDRLLDITMLLPTLEGPGWRANLRKKINTLLSVPRLHQIFQEAEHEENPFATILKGLDITPDLADLRERIPETGACIVVANHPNGGSDALTLLSQCIGRRRDTLALANSLLMGLPGVGKWLIPLNIMGQEAATQRNQLAMKAALGHLSRGGVLLVFPAGTLSHWRGDMGRVADPVWSNHIARLAKKAMVPVLPVRIFEKNPAWFTVLGALHLNVRSALVPRLLISSSGKSLICRAGRIIEPSELEACSNAREATGVIRQALQVVKQPQ